MKEVGLIKKEKRLHSIYEQWKILIRKSRDNLKEDVSETELATMADDIEKGTNEIMKLYDEIRGKVMPSTQLRRRIDACEAVTRDVMKIILERISQINGEFNEGHERSCLNQLLAHDYAHSIYGSVASHSQASQHSETPSIAAKRAEAAAELAAKEAHYKIVQEEIKQKK